MPSVLKTLIIGFGPLGVRLADRLNNDPRFDLKAIVDNDKTKLGKDFNDLKIELDLDQALAQHDIDLAFLVTSSHLEKVKDLISKLAAKKISVISSCEELVFPFNSHPELAKELDDQAKAHGVRLLGTGINPGFLMDYLITILAKPFFQLVKVLYQRNINTNFRRETFKTKVGVGLSLEEFEKKRNAGLIGHVGFRQSADMIAHNFSWRLKRFSENLEPVVVDGIVKGIDQKAICKYENGHSIELCFKAVEDLSDSDKILLDFESLDVPLMVSIPAGINGENATVAMLMNSAQKLFKLNPGLQTMLDL